MVQIRDRVDEIEFLRMALNTVGISVDYEGTDLIIETKKALDKKNGKFSLLDAAKIQNAWQKKWDMYYSALRKKRQKQEQGQAETE